MLNRSFRLSWLVGGWIAAVALMVGASMAMDANVSTTAFVLALGIAPAIVIAMLAHGQPSPSVADILHPIDPKDGRP